MRQYLTAPQLADLLGISRAGVYNLLHRGLPSVKIGRSRRFDPAAVEAWLSERQEAA